MCKRWLSRSDVRIGVNLFVMPVPGGWPTTVVTVVANATADGPAISKNMWRSGVLVLLPERLEVWRRSAVLAGEPEGRLGKVSLSQVARASLGRRDAVVRLQLQDEHGQELLSVTVTPVDPDEAARAEDALGEWLAGAQVSLDPLEFATLGDAATKTFGKVRDRARGTVDTLTLQEFRDAMDAAMGQVVEVLSVHEAEISHLQQREHDLTARLESLEQERDR